jgi:hypothetical protein
MAEHVASPRDAVDTFLSLSNEISPKKREKMYDLIDREQSQGRQQTAGHRE